MSSYEKMICKTIMRYLICVSCLVLGLRAQSFFNGQFERTFPLKAGEVVEVSAGLTAPSKLPPNGRITVEFGGMRKVLHALDPDWFFYYRAPKAATYKLTAQAVENEDPIFNLPRWREIGSVALLKPFPQSTPWPKGLAVPWRAEVKPLTLGVSTRGMTLELEPNNSIAEAQPLLLGARDIDENLHIIGGADDIEYFDNGQVTKGPGDDYFRLEFKGSRPRLFTASLLLPDPFVVARLRVFTADGKEYKAGQNANERVHQQLEEHRTAITRRFEPGGVYFLAVEANSPGYEVELRLRDLGPHTDPRKAVSQAMYDHMTQVHAWLLNRPRGASVDRRIRDTGSLLGTICMSCHTQSSIWGPALPMLHGYPLETTHNLRQLINTMYECLRPTNTLVEAANNTSLAPLDLGDGPAGTRAAGFNVVMAEMLTNPKRLHSTQQLRTANFIVQSADPSGINAAGPGSNYGQAVVYRFAGAILERAWRDTRNPKYFEALEEKATRLLDLKPKYTDDHANRIEFFRKIFPYPGHKLEPRILPLLRGDELALRKLRRPDGCWGFDDKGECDPAPTALALTALAALGFDDRDSAVKGGVDWLLRVQDPYGRWNKSALTGFVTTAYVEHALARLYPVTPKAASRADFEPRPGESLLDTLARFRALAQLGLKTDDRQFTPLALSGSSHPVGAVRYLAQIALGALRDDRGLTAQFTGAGDSSKMVREAARWGLRQTLLDDKGWDHLFDKAAQGDDLTRETLAGALVMRADAVMSRSSVGFDRLGRLLDRWINDDTAPAVRAWAARAAWNWWIYNPPVRDAVNRAVLRALERDEPSILAENSLRFQLEALFIANGQRANGSKEHQYPELSQLFERISKRLDTKPPEVMIDRLTAIAATYYSQAGGDGGPGQMGYVTEHSAPMMGKAVLAFWVRAEAAKDPLRLKLAIEAAANIVHDPLQKKLLDYASTGPEQFRTLASTSLADPRLISLPATQEFVEPLMEQFHRGANEPERRTELVGPIVKLFQRARWNLPKTDEQQRIFYQLLIPKWSPERGKLEENTRPLLQMEKDPVDWFVATMVSNILHGNPDLQTPMLLANYPTTFETPMQERLWAPAVKWLLRFGQEVPEVGAAPQLPKEFAPVRDRAVDLTLKALDGKADRRTRNAITALAGDPIVRKHPTIGPALKRVSPQYFEDEPEDVVQLSPDWRRNWEYFRDWVAPEMTKPNREDQMSCLGCHGVPGRVPSMELANADDLGYVKMKGLASNYRALLERVNEGAVDQSKILRKPLNIQSGKEDGHQGGRRFNPNDQGYKILETWVRDVARLKGQKLSAGR
ncbi:MAG: HEAT repeat domain-containing protein [Acidobacteriota bacterium]